MNSANFPKEWYCPITHELLVDPVQGSDGHTYSRVAIEKWLSTNYRSPMTNQPMTVDDLTPNYALRNSMETIMNGGSFVVDASTVLPQSKVSALSSLNLECNRFDYEGQHYIHTKVKSPVTGEIVETLFICLIDISGSMGTEASIRNEHGESDGLSRRDIVNHALKTNIEAMNDSHYACFIPFSTSASILMEPTKMSSVNKSRANDLIDSMVPTNTTNIWAALNLGIDVALRPEHANKLVSIMLFTDGVPNSNPPSGIVKTLESKLSKVSQRPNFIINTYGFGYELDSPLLRKIANIGNGTYGFIPDASMVGTTFVNSTCNSLLTYALNQQIRVSSDVDNTVINIGSLQYGQDRDFVFKVPPTKDISVELGGNKVVVKHDDVQPIKEDFAYHFCRKSVIDLISELLQINMYPSHDSIATSMGLVSSTYEHLSSQFGGSEKIVELLKDLKSDDPDQAQIMKAVSRLDWYQKWGRHYLPANQMGHQHQQCINFKDPGLQLYGSDSFSELREQVEEKFCKIPPPIPSARSNYGYRSLSSANTIGTAPVNMTRYVNSGGSCFDGKSTVALGDNTKISIENLQKGDILLGGAKVVCIVKTKIKDTVEVVNLNGMLITPWHPVLDMANWKFPINMKTSEFVKLDYVYNIVLDSGHVCVINDVHVVTLGHNFTDNHVVSHDYYGSQKVIDDLKKLNGWEDGLIVIDEMLVKRDSKTGHVKSITSV